MHADRWAHANVECGENVSRVEKNVTKCGKKVENWREKIIIQNWSVSKLNDILHRHVVPDRNGCAVHTFGWLE